MCYDRAEIISVKDLLSMNLSIPNYQRPYKWGLKNIANLLVDIEHVIAEKERYGSFKYRVGTIILHNNEEKDSYDIIDGQQRCISFLLLSLFLEPGMLDCSLLDMDFLNPYSQENIHENYQFIRDWFVAKKDEEKKAYLNALSNILEVVVLVVSEEAEAFQLFDSQNTRGRELDPHDLLKAYHLREMRNYPYEMQRSVTKWEAIKPADIKKLFGQYLFPIMNWSNYQKSRVFTSKEIDVYKGISETSPYTYAARSRKAMPAFQISESFIAGKDFFEMVEYYLYLLNFVKREVYGILFRNSKIKKMLEEEKSVGFGYAKQLFECAALCYYDRFRNFDPQAIKKLFSWSFMVRVDMDSLSFDTINRYALGMNENSNYSNAVPMFSAIKNARVHTEVASIPIKVRRDPDQAKNVKKWNTLYERIKEMNGY